MKVTIEYDGGIEPEIDGKLYELAVSHGGGDGLGSGCMLGGAMTRDIDFEIPEDQAATFKEKADKLVQEILSARAPTT